MYCLSQYLINATKIIKVVILSVFIPEGCANSFLVKRIYDINVSLANVSKYIDKFLNQHPCSYYSLNSHDILNIFGIFSYFCQVVF